MLASFGVLAFLTGIVVGQASHPPSTLMLVREQLGSIAGEACGKLELGPQSSVALTVEAPKDARLTENAFLEVLEGRGYRAYLRRDRDSADAWITVSLLTDKTEFEQIRHDATARTVQIEAEIRAEYQGSKPAQVLGIFKRSVRDTVSGKDLELFAPDRGTVATEDASFFQRLVGPLVVLASGILVVYLFFTVRS